ncbi:MAG: hypothetical protein VCC04_12665 [Myxococcota bacterium]
MANSRPDHSKDGRRPQHKFRPRFSIGMIYLVGFFFLFAFLQILPDLVGLLDLPPGPEQERAARELAREHSDPLTSLLLSVLATSVGGYYQVLPGLREG